MYRTARRLAALTAPLAAGGLLLAAAPASAVNESAPDTFGAQTRGDVLRLALSPSPEESGALDLITAAGRAAHDSRTPSGDLSAAFASLGASQSPGDAEASPFPGGAEADLQDPGPNEGDGGGTPEDSPLPIALTLGDFTAQVDPETLGNSSRGQLIDVSIGSLRDILPPELIAGLEQLQAGLQDGTGQLGEAVTQITTGLQAVCDPLAGGLDEALGDGGLGQVTGPLTDGATGTPLSPVADGLNDLLGDVPETCQDLLDTLNALPDTLNTLIGALLDTALLELDGLEAEQAISQTGEAVTGTATTKLASLRLLAGLATLEGFQNSATATVSGEPGAGTAQAVPSVAEVNLVDGTLELALDATGLRATLGELGIATSLVDTLDAALQTILDQLNEGLANLGVQVKAAEGSTTIAPDGTAATARADGILITVTLPPPPEGETATPLLEVAIGDAAVAVAAANVVQPPPVAQPGPTLPRTGVPALAGLAGIGLVAAAGVALRRRRESADDLL